MVTCTLLKASLAFATHWMACGKPLFYDQVRVRTGTPFGRLIWIPTVKNPSFPRTLPGFFTLKSTGHVQGGRVYPTRLNVVDFNRNPKPLLQCGASTLRTLLNASKEKPRSARVDVPRTARTPHTPPVLFQWGRGGGLLSRTSRVGRSSSQPPILAPDSHSDRRHTAIPPALPRICPVVRNSFAHVHIQDPPF